MNPRFRVLAVLILVLVAGGVGLLMVSTGSDSGAKADSAGEGRRGSKIDDAPLTDSQDELLEFAYEVASAIPLDPHIKDRSKSQAAVVETCLELDQPGRARRYSGQIENWRRGVALADVATHLVLEGDREVQYLLDLAREVAEAAAVERHAQAWRVDRVRSHIAQTYLLLGKQDEADAITIGLATSETGTMQEARARQVELQSLAGYLERLEPSIAGSDFDTRRGILAGLIVLYGRFYEKTADRDLILETIERAWAKTPLLVRIETMMALIDETIERGDLEYAERQVADTWSMLDSVEWLPEHRVPLMGQLAALRFRAGDAERGRAEADEAFALFESDKERIVNIYRAKALRPIAEAYLAMGARDQAAKVYGTAIEEGYENPNNRPRAMDLAATCCSMATHGFEPDEAMMARMREIREGFGDPW